MDIEPGWRDLLARRFFFSEPYSQNFLAFALSCAKEVFQASPRIYSSVQKKEEPQVQFEKRFFVSGSSKGDNGFENILN